MKNDLLSGADDAWSEGHLVRALELYANARSKDGSSWHAAFQHAWISAAFGPVPEAELARLRRPGLSDEAADLLATLVERVRDRQADEQLPGTVRDWDIATLEAKPEASDRLWWERCADSAIATGQWGLAQACFDGAAEVAPAMYHDPPRRAQGIQAQLETHLSIVHA